MRKFALLKNIKPGDTLTTDAGFDCMSPGSKKTVFALADKLFICCKHGHHLLDGQLDNEGYLIGLYDSNSKVSNTSATA